MKAKFRNWTGAGLIALKEAAWECGVTMEQIRSGARHAHVALARHYAWAILRAMGKSYPVIGRLCGGYDHTTVMNGIERLGPEEIQKANAFAQALADRVVTEQLSASRRIVAEHFEVRRLVTQAQRGGVN